jgi:hypothetical protein
MGKLETAVKELAQKPEARADPFTGTQGVELRRRIERLETEDPRGNRDVNRQ